MTDAFMWGMVCGLLFMGLCWWLSHQGYKTSLLMSANQNRPEKIGNGFYYIIPEREWVDVLVERLVVRK